MYVCIFELDHYVDRCYSIFMQRWFVDGSVKCFTGGHLPLAIVAILILMFYILLIAFVTATAMKKIKVSHNLPT